jgi:hypothetical protein
MDRTLEIVERNLPRLEQAIESACPTRTDREAAVIEVVLPTRPTR